MTRRALLPLLCLIAVMLLNAWPFHAAVAAPRDSDAQAHSIDQIQSQIAALKKAPLPDDTDQQDALGSYQQALQSLKHVEDYRQRTQSYKQALQDAPAKTRKIRNSLENANANKSPEPVPPNANSQHLQDLLTQNRSKLAALQSQLGKIDGELRATKTRPDAARDELAKARQALQNIASTLAGLAGSDQNATVMQARRDALLAKQTALTAEVNMLEHELMSNAARTDLLSAERDQLRQQVSAVQDKVDQLRSAINARQREDALSALRQARKAQTQAQGLPPVVQQAAAENAKLSNQLNKLTGKIASITRERENAREDLQRITADYQTAQQQLAIAGLTQALGEVLREQRQKLPKIAQFQRQPQTWSERIAEARLRQFRIDERRRDLNDIDAAVNKLLSGQKPGSSSTSGKAPAGQPDSSQATRQTDNSNAADNGAPPAAAGKNQAAIRKALSKLLQDRQNLLDQLSNTYSRYVDLLTGLRRDQEALSQEADAYAKLLDESLIWIASAKPIGIRWISGIGSSILWLFSPTHWRTILGSLLLSARNHWWLPPLVLIPFAGLIELRRRMRRRLRAITENIGNVTRDRFHFTLEALAYAVLFALAWPLPVAGIGHLLVISQDATVFTSAIGIGLERSAVWLLILDSFRRLCDHHGLIDAHFRWKPEVRRLMRRHLTWLMALELPCTLVIVLTETQPEQSYRDTLGRLAFLVGSIGLAVFMWLMFRRKSGVLAVHTNGRDETRAWRLRDLAYLMAVGGPIVLTGLAMAGYYFTALQLEGKFFISGWLIVGAVVIVNLVIRWLNVAERRLALSRARARREQAQAQRAADKEGGSNTDLGPEALDVPEIDLATISDQTRALLRLFVGLGVLVGLWLVWHDLLPALSVLDQVVLWHQTLGAGAGTKVIPITLGNLGVFFILLLVTVMGARNLPGLLELTILQRLALEPGTRYATTAVSRYIIVAAGLVFALDTIGIGWQQAQWLVAAIGVGLGFGLQEIFANFVSGLIILFERPVRIGDTVTVGAVSGTVSRIRMRATTITDWDRKELIVPNKNFITDQVVNWSLSDPTLRTVIKIGVAYGSNTELVHQLISDLASNHPLVLDDPPPRVYFLSFGDSSLNFEVRLYVRDIDDLMPLLHEMHMGLERALREAGIEIAFPQRDIHVRSVTHDLQVGTGVANTAGDKPEKSGAQAPAPDPGDSDGDSG